MVSSPRRWIPGGIGLSPGVRHPHGDQLQPPNASFAPARAGALSLEELVAIVRRAQAGDAAAQSELIRAYSRRVGGLVRTVVRHPSATEDLVHMLHRMGLREDIELAPLIDAAREAEQMFGRALPGRTRVGGTTVVVA